MKYLFWNTNKQDINNTLEILIRELECDVISLAEYTGNIKNLLKNLSDNGLQYYHVPQIACKRINIITKFTPGKIEHLNESDYYTIKKMPHEKLGYHLIVFVHLPSKLHMKDIGFENEVRFLMKDIEEAEVRTDNNKTIIVGDFNMNPFEESMVSAGWIHSTSSRKLAVTKSPRTVLKRQYSMFYNPMWNLLGDIDDPPGSYFYDKSGHLTYFWNMFDQVLVRPEVIDHFDPKSVKIINKMKNTDLVKLNGIPHISDHFPLFFEII